MVVNVNIQRALLQCEHGCGSLDEFSGRSFCDSLACDTGNAFVVLDRLSAPRSTSMLAQRDRGRTILPRTHFRRFLLLGRCGLFGLNCLHQGINVRSEVDVRCVDWLGR
jgi:hypothetical protein